MPVVLAADCSILHILPKMVISTAKLSIQKLETDNIMKRSIRRLL